jgi:Leucine-rich repeat (LRR) protein
MGSARSAGSYGRLGPGQPVLIPSARELQALHLCHNDLETLPPLPFASMAALHVLDVSFNRLRALPAAVSALTSLTELDARGNALAALDGAALAAWRALVRLALHRNDLTELPDAFAGLRQLALVDVRCVVRGTERGGDGLVRPCSLPNVSRALVATVCAACPRRSGRLARRLRCSMWSETS